VPDTPEIEMPRPIISLVIPTYNERENIELAVKRAYGVLQETARLFEIIVVDDDSPDRTWEAAEALCRDYPGLRVIRRVNERGLARAVVRGWQEARGEILAVMDGDLQHPSETLVRLIKAIQEDGVDIAVASRHVTGGGVSRWNIIRRGVSWSATLMATWVLPGTLRTIRDPMSGYFALRRSVIEGCRLEPEGYKILLEVLGRGKYQRVEEIPYTFTERKRGGSKLGPRQYGEFVVHLLRLSWQTGELKRFLKFSLVGGLGVFVNMGMLTVLTSAGLGYLPGGVFAVETAIVTNFLLNEFWTFSDFSKRRSGLTARLKRFIKFNLFCLGGAVINLSILWALTEYAGIYYLLSNLIGIGAATLWNYGMNANVTWESSRAERKEQS
jgi:dolichol-phosphate mannosyltransferase